jgi:hypothetical protein
MPLSAVELDAPTSTAPSGVQVVGPIPLLPKANTKEVEAVAEALYPLLPNPEDDISSATSTGAFNVCTTSIVNLR